MPCNLAKKYRKVNKNCILIAESHIGEPLKQGKFWSHYELYYDPENKEYILYKAFKSLDIPKILDAIIYKGKFSFQNEKWDWYNEFYKKIIETRKGKE